MPRKDAGSGPISAQAQQDLVSEGIENFELPKSLVTKIAKSAVRLVSCVVQYFALIISSDARQCQITKRDRIVFGEGFDSIHQLPWYVKTSYIRALQNC